VTATLEQSPAERPADVPASDPPHPDRPVPAALAPWRDPHPRLAWLSTAVLVVLAGLTRFWALGFPPGTNTAPKNGMNFDEVYYAVEAQEMLRFGYEDNRGYMFIVHPPLGKLLIALSEKLWDGGSGEYLTNSIGWRIAPALAGCLGVVMVSRIVRRMMRSTLFGFIAGLLMSMEGLSLVLARTAILDIFLETFVIAGFGALVVDRDAMRARLAGLIADGADLGRGAPTLGPRPWRLAGGVCLGLACAVKWTGASFFVLFAVLSVLWDRGAFRSAGVTRPTRTTLRRSVLPGFGSLLAAPAGAYLLTYLGWFTGENSFDRHWADDNSPSTHLNIFGLVRIPWTWRWVPSPVRSLAWNHQDAYRFHQSLDSGHAYASNPWSWWVLGRPVDFYYNGSETTCGSRSCAREVLLIGTPLLWWAFVPMALWLAWHWVTTRDWRAGAVWVAIIAGWLVWFQNLKRTMFLFYAAPMVPFLVIGVTLGLGVLLGPRLPRGRTVATAPLALHRHRVDGIRPGIGTLAERAWYASGLPIDATDPAQRRAEVRRRWGIAGLTTFLTLVTVDFVWMWPIFTGGLLTYDEWHAHMWLPSWV
jgi:dolichyl-phosphate-mannose--protein O-mannosyl transferase